MKVLILNGSPHPNGNTAIAINEIVKIFQANDIQSDVVQVGNHAIRGCIACRKCNQTGKCVFDDLVNTTAPLLAAADGVILASPVYYASANGTLISFLDRLFFSTKFDKTMKVGASIAVGRRGGLTATYDELNKYFAIARMPIASGQYWNGVHGRDAGEASQDAEGMQQMRTLANNMVFLMQSIALGKERYGLPAREQPTFTNFVR